MAAGHREIQALLAFIFWPGQIAKERGENRVWDFSISGMENVKCKLGIQNDMEIELHSLLHDNVLFHVWPGHQGHMNIEFMHNGDMSDDISSGSTSPL